MSRILVTGGFGFIAGNLCNYWMTEHPQDEILCVDSMTYASNADYVVGFAQQINKFNHGFMHQYVDITDRYEVRRFMQTFRPEHVIHLAAESHVCRSIEGPKTFIETNIMGTFNLLETFKELWQRDLGNHLFHHVSTDEVYGVAWGNSKFHELQAYAPRSPYAASKAASDHIVMAYHHTYGMNTVITNCSNNFGPSQHREKLIPKTIECMARGEPVRVYGNGKQVRDWIFVADHCHGIDTVFHKGSVGQSYLLGGNTELTNLEVIGSVNRAMTRLLCRAVPYDIRHTDDRPTDDQRYAIDTTKVERLGWKPMPETFDKNLEITAQWYLREMGILK